MKRRSLKPALVTLVVILILAVMIGPQGLAAPIMVLAALLLGWLPSAARLWVAWHPPLAALLLFFLAAVVMIAGTHRFLCWLNMSFRKGEANPAVPRWPWRWTLCGFGALFCAMVGICSIVLTIHQVYWMSRSPEPLFTDSYRNKAMMKLAARVLLNQAQESDWDSLKTRAAFWQGEFPGRRSPLSEVIHPVWIDQDEHRLRGVILIPRHPLHRSEANFFIIQPGSDIITQSLDQLPQVLASFGIGGGDAIANRPPTSFIQQ